jgi:AraC family ethanolamine operon transcriptional activator
MLITEKPTVFNFKDLDLFNFNNVIQSWGLDFNQLESGKLSANLTQLIHPDFQLGYAQFNLSVKQEGYSPQGVWTFAFVNDVRLFWRNYNVQPESIIVYSPGSEISAVSSAGFEVVTFSISENRLSGYAKQLGLSNIVARLQHQEVLNTSGNLWSDVRKQLLYRINKANENISPETEFEFIEQVSHSLLGLLENGSPSKTKASSKKRLKLVNNAERYMQLNLAEPLTVVDIAKEFNVSERTLLYAFRQRFLMGPKAFFKTLKLNHVYHELRSDNGDNLVSSIANQNGFTHMGQFHKDYKAFFGELPSQALAL